MRKWLLYLLPLLLLPLEVEAAPVQVQWGQDPTGTNRQVYVLNPVDLTFVPIGSLNTSTDVFSIAGTVTISCASLPALTGNVTTSAGSCATTIPANQITNSMLQAGVALANIGAGNITNTYLAPGVAVANLGFTPVNKAGDTMSGNLTIAPASGASDLISNAITGQSANIVFQINGITQSFLSSNGSNQFVLADALNSNAAAISLAPSGASTFGESGQTTNIQGTSIEAAGNFYVIINMAGGWPLTTGVGFIAIGGNHSTGNGEGDFFNTDTAAIIDFNWYQMTGVNAGNLLMSMTPTQLIFQGGLAGSANGGYVANSGSTTYYKNQVNGTELFSLNSSTATNPASFYENGGTLFEMVQSHLLYLGESGQANVFQASTESNGALAGTVTASFAGQSINVGHYWQATGASTTAPETAILATITSTAGYSGGPPPTHEKVAFEGACIQSGAGDSCWGFDIAVSSSSISGGNTPGLIGGEIDVNNNGGVAYTGLSWPYAAGLILTGGASGSEIQAGIEIQYGFTNAIQYGVAVGAGAAAAVAVAAYYDQSTTQRGIWLNGTYSDTAIRVGSSPGVTCSAGITASTFRSILGIVTHC